MIENFEESIMIGILAISGSLCSRLRYVTIAFSPSSNASSMFTSSICAPFSTCCLATTSASSNCSSLMRVANFLEPVTFVRSPTFTKFVSGLITKGSSPDNLMYGLICRVFDIIYLFRLRFQLPDMALVLFFSLVLQCV